MRLLTANELARYRRRKTLHPDEIRSLRAREVSCEFCGARMPALRLLWAGEDLCGPCNTVHLSGALEIAMDRAKGYAVLEY